VIQSSARLSTKRFLTVECGVLISSLEHFFLSDCFWQFFLFRASLFSPLKQIALVSFRSFLASGKSFAFFLSKIINSGVARTTTRSDECAQRKAVAYHRLIDFALFVCVRVRERVREQRVHDLIQLFLKWKKMYGKEIGSERATKRPKKYVSFSLSRNEEEKDDDFRSERE